MSEKIVTFNPSSQLLEGARILAEAVGSTLGPKGRNVIIESDFGAPIVTKDGVSVANSIVLTDKVQNLAAMIIKQAAAKTAKNAGDGTTTATVICYHLYKNALELVEKGKPAIEIVRELEVFKNYVLVELARLAIPVDDEAIKNIATISANNDVTIGSIIAEAQEFVGKQGVISLDDSKTEATYVKLVEGINFDKGYLSPYFVNNSDKMLVEFENPLILITDKKIRTTNEIVPAMEAAAQSSRPLVVIADDIDGQALSLMLVNKLRTGFRVVAIKAPAYGERRGELLRDMAILTGAELVTEDKAMRLEDVQMSHLGSCSKIIVSRDETSIIDPKGDTNKIQVRAKEIKAMLENVTDDYSREKLSERLAKLTAKIAVVYVGAPTETEMKEKKDRIDDALRAVKSAVKDGYVAGGGITLARLGDSAVEMYPQLDCRFVFSTALNAPFKTILSNAGISYEEDYEQGFKNWGIDNFGYNAINNSYVDLVKEGIIDPCLVLAEALVNAVSAASMLILSDTTVHHAYKIPTPIDQM